MNKKTSIVSLILIGITLVSFVITVNNDLINNGPYYQYNFKSASNNSQPSGFFDFLENPEPTMLVKSDLNNNGTNEIIFASKNYGFNINISMYNDNSVHQIFNLSNLKYTDYYPSIVTGNFDNNSLKEIIVGFRRMFIANPSFINDLNFHSLVLLKPTSNNLLSWQVTPLPIQDKYIIALASVPTKNSSINDLIISAQNQTESELVLIHNLDFSDPVVIDKVGYQGLPAFQFTPNELYFQNILPISNKDGSGYNILVTGNNELREYQNSNGTWSKHIIETYTGNQLFSGLIKVDFDSSNTYIALATYSQSSMYQNPFLAIYKLNENIWSKVEQINETFPYLGLTTSNSNGSTIQKLLTLSINHGGVTYVDQNVSIINIYSWNQQSNQLALDNSIGVPTSQDNDIYNIVGLNGKVYALGEKNFHIISIITITNEYIMNNSLYLLGIILLFIALVIFLTYWLEKKQICNDKTNLILVVGAFLFFNLLNYFFDFIKTKMTIPYYTWFAYVINSAFDVVRNLPLPPMQFFNLVYVPLALVLGISIFVFIYYKYKQHSEKIFWELLAISGLGIIISLPTKTFVNIHYFISPFIGIGDITISYNSDLISILFSLTSLVLSITMIFYGFKIFSNWSNYSTNKVLKTIKGFYSLNLILFILFLLHFTSSILLVSFLPNLIGSFGFIISLGLLTTIIIVQVNLFLASGQVLEDFFSVNQIIPQRNPRRFKLSFTSFIFIVIMIAWIILSLINYFTISPQGVIDPSSRTFYDILFDFLFTIDINSFIVVMSLIIGFFFIIFSLINHKNIDLGSTLLLGLGFSVFGFSFISGLILILISFVLLTEKDFIDDIKENMHNFVQMYFKNITDLSQSFTNSNQIELAKNTFKMMITDIERQNRVNFDLSDEELEKYTQEGLKALHEFKGGS